MKQFYLLVCIALLINTQTQAQTTQDTIYFWKGGVLNLKKSIKAADLDSLTFKRPTVVVVPIATVTIGTQTWQAKNLNVTTYRNGNVIPEVQDAVAWENLTIGAWCHYNNDPANDAIYGKLYNWYAVNDSRGLAPSGFHVPTDTELTAVTDMKDPAGFAGLPGGSRDYDGPFYGIGRYGFWWSSSEYGTASAWYRELNVIKLRNFYIASF